MTSWRLQSNRSSTVTLHGEPVVLHPVRAIPGLITSWSTGRGGSCCKVSFMRVDLIAACKLRHGYSVAYDVINRTGGDKNDTALFYGASRRDGESST